MWVENRLDEVRIGVKGQSNLVIARSPRNSFRASLSCFLTEVEILDGLGGIPAYRIQPNSECRKVRLGVRLRAIRFVVERARTQSVG